MGRSVGPPRRPLRMLDAEHRAQLVRILQDLGVLGQGAAAQAAE